MVKVAAYYRVSTTRQAEQDLSVPDQRRQARTFCQTRGWEIQREYVEPGASATDDKRPVFQQMIEEALSTERPFEIILVHSFSRFFRELFHFEWYARRLAKSGVRVVSITQQTSDDPMGKMVRQIFNLFDEYSSRENAKHTLRAMQENARQGYWNGSKPPFGYRVVAAETRGEKVKKRLAIDPVEAEIVRKIFHLYLHGDGSGPVGIKRIVSRLHEKGLTYRGQRRFSISLIHRILTRPAYKGEHHFNCTDSRTKEVKPKGEWVKLEVPRIIEPDTFERVQAILASRNPKRTPPRVVSGPTLLTGLARCASCGGAMTLRTGKSGRYRYYACSTSLRQGRAACKGRSMPMEVLDELVLTHLERRLFAPERLGRLLGKLLARAQRSRVDHQQELKELRGQLRDKDRGLQRLYNAIETGIADLDDTLRAHINGLRQEREQIIRLISTKERGLTVPYHVVSPRKLEAFFNAVRARLRDSASGLRKTYLRLFIDRIEVDDAEVRIRGPRGALLSGLQNSHKIQQGVVPTFVQEGRPQGDALSGVHCELHPGLCKSKPRVAKLHSTP